MKRYLLLWLPVLLICLVTGLYHWAGYKTPVMRKLTGLTMYVGYFIWLYLLVLLIKNPIPKDSKLYRLFIGHCNTILLLIFNNKILTHLGSVATALTSNAHFPDAYNTTDLSYFAYGITAYYFYDRVIRQRNKEV